MTTVTIREAENQLAHLIARAEAGEEILIARDGEPVVELTSMQRGGRSVAKRRVFGSLKGKYSMPPDGFFFDPLPDDELKAWEGTENGLLLAPGDIPHDTSISKDKP